MSHSFRGAALLLSLALGPPIMSGDSAQATGLDDQAIEARHGIRLVPFSAAPIRSSDPIASLGGARGFIFEVGMTIRSEVGALYRMDRFFGDYWAATLRDGRWVVFRRSERGLNPVDEIRIARSSKLAGLPNLPFHEEATSRPRISGYDYVTSFPVGGTANAYLGLWRARGARAERSLLVLFESVAGADPRLRCEIMARSHLDFSLLWVSPSLHGELWSIVLVSRAPRGRPIHFLRYAWIPGPMQNRAAAGCG